MRKDYEQAAEIVQNLQVWIEKCIGLEPSCYASFTWTLYTLAISIEPFVIYDSEGVGEFTLEGCKGRILGENQGTPTIPSNQRTGW